MVVLSMCEDRGMVELIHRKVYLFGKEDLGEMSITDSVSVLAFGLVLGFGIVLYEEWKTERKRRLLASRLRSLENALSQANTSEAKAQALKKLQDAIVDGVVRNLF